MLYSQELTFAQLTFEVVKRISTDDNSIVEYFQNLLNLLWFGLSKQHAVANVGRWVTRIDRRMVGVLYTVLRCVLLQLREVIEFFDLWHFSIPNIFFGQNFEKLIRLILDFSGE